MIKFYIALVAAKLSVLGCKVLKNVMHRNGTNLPGEIALKICPGFLRYVGRPETIITVTGTNGKTTTTNMIADALEMTGHKVLSNRAGGNIASGIATCLLNGVNLFNRCRYPIGVLEVDERSSLRIYPYVQPDYAICTNLARDSCMRNAHPHYIFDIIDRALPEKSLMILNADDIISSSLKKDNRRVYYAIDKQPEDKTESFNIINDMRICPDCQELLTYDYVRYNHIGKVRCPRCGLHSPDADFRVTEVDREKGLVTIVHGAETETYPLVSESIFNLYNELTVVTFLRTFGIGAEEIRRALADTQIVSSRYKSETVEGIRVISTMAKGWIAPAVSVVFDFVSKLPGRKEIVLMIEDTEDNISSSENLSYIYETDFEFLNKPEIENIVVVGVRAKDYLLRLLLAGVDREKIHCTDRIGEIPQLLHFEQGKDVHIIYDLHQMDAYAQIHKAVTDGIKGGRTA